MIIKIIPSKKTKRRTARRRGFVNLLQYHDRNLSELVHTEKILGATPIELAAYFDEVAARGTRVKQPVFHAVISFAPDELDPEPTVINEIAACYLQQLGYGHQPWIMYRHNDKQHTHYHLISCRVDVRTGRGIDSSFEGKRSVKILKELARLYGYQVGRGEERCQRTEIIERIIPDRAEMVGIPQRSATEGQASDSEYPASQRMLMQQGLVERIDQIVREVLVNDQPYSMYRFIQSCHRRGLKVQKFRRGYVVKSGKDYPVALSKLPAFAEKRLSCILQTNKQFRRQQMRYISTSIRQTIQAIPALDMQHERVAELFAEKLASLLSVFDINVIYNTNNSGVVGVSFEHTGVIIKGSEMKLSWETILQIMRHKTPIQPASVVIKQTSRVPASRYRTLVAGVGVGRRMSEDEEEKKQKDEQKEI